MTDIRAAIGSTASAGGAWRPYLRLARLDRPIGTWLLLFPGLVGDRPGRAEAGRIGSCIALFGIGAVAMRGAGCTLNDIVDRDFDAKVASAPAARPLPSGAVSVRPGGAASWRCSWRSAPLCSFCLNRLRDRLRASPCCC